VLSRNDLVFTTRGVTSMLGVVSGPPPSTRMPIGDLIPGLELAQVYRLRLVEIGTSIAGGTSRAFAPPSASRQQITIRQSGDGLRADTSVAVDGGDGRWSSAEARFTYREPKWAMTVRLGRLGVSTRGSSIWGGVQVGAPLGRGATLTAGAATASRLLYAEGIGSGRHTINLGLGFNTSLFAPSSRGAAPEASRPAFSVTRSVGDSYRIAIHLEGAHAVDFASDATGWQPRAMTRSGDDWILDLPIARGVHHANIRVDAEEWIVPPGLTPVDDDFAGHVGAFVVE
jgi:hypothetical protein